MAAPTESQDKSTSPTEASSSSAKSEEKTANSRAALAETAEKKSLGERVEKARKTEPKSVVARYEALATLFDELLAQLTSNLEKVEKADALEKESLELSQKKERALYLLEQTEARRARAELRIRQLEGASDEAGKSKPATPPTKGAPSAKAESAPSESTSAKAKETP